jgi:hypothetical protein
MMTRRAEAAAGERIRVVMTKTMRGSENGIDVTLFEKGQEYNLEASLATAFLKSKNARQAPVQEPSKTPDGGTGEKGGKGPDENK